MLLVLLRTVMPPRERKNQWIVSLYFAELPRFARVIRQLIVGESVPRNDVRTHLWTLSMKMATQGKLRPSTSDQVPGGIQAFLLSRCIASELWTTGLTRLVILV